MSAVHVQLREDAELGAALRRCRNAMPTDAGVDGRRPRLLSLVITEDHTRSSVSLWRGNVRVGDITRSHLDPTDALNALADALEARAAE